MKRARVAASLAVSATIAAAHGAALLARLEVKLALWRLRSRRSFKRNISVLPGDLARELVEAYEEEALSLASPRRQLATLRRLVRGG